MGGVRSVKFLIDPTSKLAHEIIEKEWYLSSIFGDDAELLSLLESCLAEDRKKRIHN